MQGQVRWCNLKRIAACRRGGRNAGGFLHPAGAGAGADRIGLGMALTGPRPPTASRHCWA